MNQQEFTDKLKAIEDNYLSEKKGLMLAYARANRKFKDGEVIKDGVSSGHIIRMKWAWGNYPVSPPMVCYLCVELKKDGTPKMDKKTQKVIERIIYEQNIL